LAISTNLDELELCRIFFEAVVDIAPFSCGKLLVRDPESEGIIVQSKTAGGSFVTADKPLSPVGKVDLKKIFPQEITTSSLRQFAFLQENCSFEKPVITVTVLPVKVEDQIRAAILLGNLSRIRSMRISKTNYMPYWITWQRSCFINGKNKGSFLAKPNYKCCSARSPR
jgi:hypothetical protein